MEFYYANWDDEKNAEENAQMAMTFATEGPSRLTLPDGASFCFQEIVDRLARLESAAAEREKAAAEREKALKAVQERLDRVDALLIAIVKQIDRFTELASLLVDEHVEE